MTVYNSIKIVTMGAFVLGLGGVLYTIFSPKPQYKL